MKLLLHLIIFSNFLTTGGITEEKEVLRSRVAGKLILNEKETAFSVLQAKCNVCQVKRNKRKVFSLTNMDGFVTEINQQVFVKKRMPRGNVILSEKDKTAISNWINNLNK